MPERPENRIERIVDDLLHGRRLRLRAGDAEEKEAIIAAARLAAARSGPQRMSPAFRRRLAQILESAPRDPRLTRRAALVAGLGVAAGALAGGIVGRELASSPAPLPPSSSSPVVPRNGRWTDVGAMADFSDGQPSRMSVPPGFVHVRRQAEQPFLHASGPQRGQGSRHRGRPGGGAGDLDDGSGAPASPACARPLPPASRGSPGWRSHARRRATGDVPAATPRPGRRDRRPSPGGSARRSGPGRHLRAAGTAAWTGPGGSPTAQRQLGQLRLAFDLALCFPLLLQADGQGPRAWEIASRRREQTPPRTSLSTRAASPRIANPANEVQRVSRDRRSFLDGISAWRVERDHGQVEAPRPIDLVVPAWVRERRVRLAKRVHAANRPAEGRGDNLRPELRQRG